MRQLYDRHMGSRLGRTTRRARGVAKASTASTTASCGNLHQVLKARLIAFVRRRVAPGPPSGGTSPPSASRRRWTLLDPERPDHRLRPPLRHLQAGDAAPVRPRAAAALLNDRRRARSSSSSPARRIPQDDAGQGAAAGRSSDALPRVAVLGARGLRRRLRHQPRPAPGAGRRRLAQQPAPSARGVRHQRAEGGAQRRPQPVDPRRLVGRGLRRAERLRHRPGREPRRYERVQDERDAEHLYRDARATRSSRCSTPRRRRVCRAPGSPA